MKHVSVIVVHYAQTDDFNTQGINRSEGMKQSLESLFSNTDYPAEIIVMDNGGNPDDTEWLLEKVREKKIDTLIRFKENMQFSFAWNQGARIATGDYLCFTCNDIVYHEGWLSTCVELLEKYPDRKFISSPYLTPDKDVFEYVRGELDGNRLNALAGSNCMVLRKEVWQEIGEFPHYRIGGSIWHRLMHSAGYLVILPPVDKAHHLAWRKGVNWRKHIEIVRTLLNGEKVDFSYKTKRKSIFGGSQKKAGI